MTDQGRRAVIRQQIEFVRAQAAEARKWERSRRESATVWRGGSEQDHREAHRLAERMAGRQWPYQEAKQREESAAVEERIADKYRREADMFDAIARELDALLSAQAAQPEDGIRFDEQTGTYVARHTILTAARTEAEAHAALASAVNLTAKHWPTPPPAPPAGTAEE